MSDEYNEVNLDGMAERWERVNDEFIKFENIPKSDRPFTSPDICAFALLDKKFPAERDFDMVSCAGHDEIYLRIESEQIAQLTDDEILYLTRCGVRYEDDTESLALFV